MSHPKHEHQEISGKFQHVIFSPRGGIEGILLEVDGAPTQLVVDEEADSAALAALHAGQKVKVEAAPQKPSHKGEAVHALHRLHRLISIEGKKVVAEDEAPATFTGTVARFNFARHGEPNGVVLDNGDFIHLKPGGMAAAAVKVGDRVTAKGESRPLRIGGGRVVEAHEFNGSRVKKKAPPHQ